MKKTFCLILAMVMLFCFNSFAFAEAPASDSHLGEGVERVDVPVIPNPTRGMSGYASKFVSVSESGSFTVTVTGSYCWKAGFTFKTSCDESNYATAVVTIQRPNGAYLLQDSAFYANEEEPFTFYLAFPGTYTISYAVYVPSGATLQMQCWIYDA